MKQTLILGSSSKYRAVLLQQLRVPFLTASPNIDETPLHDEAPRAVAIRLARAKAQAVAKNIMQASHAAHVETANKKTSNETYIIGSDQVLDLAGEALGKPHTYDVAVAQLNRLSGKTVHYYTAVCLAKIGADGHMQFAERCNTITVKYRTLSAEIIETYLRLDTPYDCAGSTKSESLGIALTESISSTDPTALVGLPLTDTLTLLAQLGYSIWENMGQAEVKRG